MNFPGSLCLRKQQQMSKALSLAGGLFFLGSRRPAFPSPPLRLLSTAAGEPDPRRDVISSAYRRAVQFRRPSTIYRWTDSSANSVSLIGSVASPVRLCSTKQIRRLGVYTCLRVDQSSHRSGSPDSFLITLSFWDELAEISLEYLKPRDIIYVSGTLGTYDRVNDFGENEIHYQINVRELNYVSCQAKKESLSKTESCKVGGEEAAERSDRLRLWQIFLANPHEWWDNRKDKKYPNGPDFRHKDTKESLWVLEDDPPWIKKQLELLDARTAQTGFREHAHKRIRTSEWQFNDFKD